MKLVIISDIHLYMHRRITDIQAITAIPVHELYNMYTVQHIYEKVRDQADQTHDTLIIFLGDVFDTAYIKEPETEIFKNLLRKLQNLPRVTIKIIVGNHDSSSKIPKNKIKFSPYKYITNEFPDIELTTDYTIQKVNSTVLVLMSYYQRQDMYNTFNEIFNKIAEIKTSTVLDIVFCTHNNIYLTETLHEGRMYAVRYIVQLLNETLRKNNPGQRVNLTIVNGHLHFKHLENNITSTARYVHENDTNPTNPVKRVNYYQPGSVSSTSFKHEIVSSGIVVLNVSESDLPERVNINESTDQNIRNDLVNIINDDIVTDIITINNTKVLLLSILTKDDVQVLVKTVKQVIAYLSSVHDTDIDDNIDNIHNNIHNTVLVFLRCPVVVLKSVKESTTESTTVPITLEQYAVQAVETINAESRMCKEGVSRPDKMKVQVKVGGVQRA